MPPAEKHILEIDSAELAFGERRILSGVYLLVETGGVTAVLGRNGCGKSCLMKILSGSLKAGFCSMRIDGKWHRRFTEKEIRYLPQHPFIPGWLRLERALGDFGLQREDLERWFPEFIPLRETRIGELAAALLYRGSRKRCAVCGAAFVPKSNRGKYCPGCAGRMKKIKAAERKRKQRHKCHALEPFKPA